MAVREEGYIDPFMSRRTNFFLCEYWHLDEKLLEADRNEIVHMKSPTGKFYAKLERELNYENQTVSGSFIFEQTTTTISTTDIVDQLKPNDIVVLGETAYRVVSKMSAPVLKNTQFMGNPSKITYISLKG